jgi:hypothetical protein
VEGGGCGKVEWSYGFCFDSCHLKNKKEKVKSFPHET